MGVIITATADVTNGCCLRITFLLKRFIVKVHWASAMNPVVQILAVPNPVCHFKLPLSAPFSFSRHGELQLGQNRYEVIWFKCKGQ